MRRVSFVSATSFNDTIRHRLQHNSKKKTNDLIRLSSTTSSSSNSSGRESFQNKRSLSLPAAFVLAGSSVLAGYVAGISNGQSHQKNVNDLRHRELPNGHPRSCCSCEAPQTETIFEKLTKEQKSLPSKLANVVGKSNVISGLQEDYSNTMFLKGARLGRGKALAIVTPTSLQDAVKVLQLVVDSDCVVVPQGANTG